MASFSHSFIKHLGGGEHMECFWRVWLCWVLRIQLQATGVQEGTVNRQRWVTNVRTGEYRTLWEDRADAAFPPGVRPCLSGEGQSRCLAA